MNKFDFKNFLPGLSKSISSWQGLVSIAAVIVLCVIIHFIIKKNSSRSGLTTRKVVAIGIGAALYGALSAIQIPIGPNTSLRLAIALLPIFGAIFGPVVGFLVGFIGHALNDALTYGSVWWSWVFLSGIMGLFSGFITMHKNFDVLQGKINKKHYVEMYLYAIIGMVAGSIVAFCGDVFLYGESPAKVWLQIILANLSNFIIIAVIGIPVVIGIAIRNKKNTNLELDE